MKSTIDIPDELYRRVKARAAMLGRPVREVTIEVADGPTASQVLAADRDRLERP